MSEVGAPGAGAPASAPAETSVPLPDSSQGRLPNPASTPTLSQDEVSEGQPPSGKERRSIGESLDKALEAAKTEPKTEPKAKPEPKAEPKAPPKAEAKPAAAKDEPAKASPRERDDGGRFASTQPREEPAVASQDGEAPHHQPPHRFSPEAKAEWANVPDTVKAEVHRAHRELENGYHKYRQDAEAYHEVRDFGELARQSGTNLKAALTNYVGIESRLASGDPQQVHEALQTVFKRANVDPKAWAAHVLNQPAPTPDQREAELNRHFQAQAREIAELKQQVGNVTSTFKEQERQQILAVASDPQKFPRFDELRTTMGRLTAAGMTEGTTNEEILASAYQMADRLIPSASRSSPLNPEPRPANGAGTKSIAGSPANGSNPSLPAHRKGQRPSVKDSVDRARARLGP